jgi:Glycosyl transferase 4-like domain
LSTQAPRWLILAHPFNMDGRAASHTITDKIPHLLAHGIELVVISGVTGEKDTRFEHHQVWSAGPSGFKFELRHVLRQRLKTKWAYRLVMLMASLLLLPFIFFERLFKPVESSWSWQFSAQRLGRQLAQHKPFDLIYSTAGPFAAHLAAQHLKKHLNVPWLAEIHDPLVLPGTTPQTRRQRAYADVERCICTDADIAIWFTDQAMASALARQPALGNRGRVMLPGVDDPFDGLPMPPYVRGKHFVLGHFGSLSNSRTLLPFVHALSLLKDQEPAAYADIRIHVYGGRLDDPSAQAAEQLGVMDRIVEFGRLETDPVTGLSGRDQVLHRMRGCDVLALVHGDDAMCAEYIPSKLYEYLWMHRPIVATVHDNSQMSRLLTEMGHAVTETSVLNGEKSTKASVGLVFHMKNFWQKWKLDELQDFPDLPKWSTKRSVQQLIKWARHVSNDPH